MKKNRKHTADYYNYIAIQHKLQIKKLFFNSEIIPPINILQETYLSIYAINDKGFLSAGNTTPA